MDEPTDRSGGDAAGAERHRFLCGADMDPTAVRAAYPGARFVARARLATEPGGDDPAPEEIWGILLRLPPGDDPDQAAAEERGVVADDGRRLRAVAVGGGQSAGDPAAVLAAARFWELPPAYIRRLVGSEPGGDAAETG